LPEVLVYFIRHLPHPAGIPLLEGGDTLKNLLQQVPETTKLTTATNRYGTFHVNFFFVLFKYFRDIPSYANIHFVLIPTS
jgi:hypothetical protein